MDKDSKITKVEVTDKDNNVLISMNYNKIEYDKKFSKDYFELNNIIKTEEQQNNKSTNSNNSTSNNIKDNTTTENSNDENSTNSNKNSNNTTNENSNNIADSNNSTNNENNPESNSNNRENTTSTEKTEQTASIEDIIYPMYLPDNTYLTSQDRIDTADGERLILTFGGDNSFTLVEETISNTDSNIVIPVSGEFDFLSDVIGIIGTNSVMWQSNGIEYYMTSNTMETSVLVDIARSISVLPVSK